MPCKKLSAAPARPLDDAACKALTPADAPARNAAKLVAQAPAASRRLADQAPRKSAAPGVLTVPATAAVPPVAVELRRANAKLRAQDPPPVAAAQPEHAVHLPTHAPSRL